MTTNNFKDTLKKIKRILKRELVVLWIFGVLLGLALIALSNKNKLPLERGDFAFISLLALLFALYRPRWIFFLLLSAIPLENIILTGTFLPIQLRPYQFLEVILAVAVAILYISKKLKFKILKPNWLDWLIFSLWPLSFLSFLNSPVKSVSLKNNLVLLSFVVLYFLIRNFLRERSDLAKATFFFLGSFLVVLFYGFYQVFAEKFGARSFEVMFGRPNSTFAEPDWLGIFLNFALAILLTIVLFEVKSRVVKFALYLIIFLDLILLILTLSRSAWVGAAAVIIFWLLFSLYKKDKAGTTFTPRKFFDKFVAISLILLISLIAIRLGKLSKFDVFDRFRSTATSEQKITIACDKNGNIPASIENMDELLKYNCRHINLEEINFYKSQGKIVTEIFRQDPNILTRSAIYQKSWEIIKTHPIFGVGFGTITQKLGSDERGTGLNESNLFLQIWAGTGILGLIFFLLIIGSLFIHSFRSLSPICPLNKFFGCPIVKDNFEKLACLFAVLAIIALIIPNLFNAGLFLGIFWLGLAAFVSIKEVKN